MVWCDVKWVNNDGEVLWIKNQRNHKGKEDELMA